MHQITDKMEKPAYALFVNLAVAFDHVDKDRFDIYSSLPKTNPDINYETDLTDRITIFAYNNRASSNSG